MASKRAKLIADLAVNPRHEEQPKPLEVRKAPKSKVVPNGVQASASNGHKPPAIPDLGFKEKVSGWLSSQSYRRKLQFSPTKKGNNTSTANPNQCTATSSVIPSACKQSENVTPVLETPEDLGVQVLSTDSAEVINPSHKPTRKGDVLIPSDVVDISPTVTVIGIETAGNEFNFTDSTTSILFDPLLEVTVNTVGSITLPKENNPPGVIVDPAANATLPARNNFAEFNFTDSTASLLLDPLWEVTVDTVEGTTLPEGSNISEVIVDGVEDASEPARNNIAEAYSQDPAVTPSNLKRTSGSSVRKRSSTPALWKANVHKLAANSGQEYVSARGKLVKAKEMRPPCSCKLDCVHRISEGQRMRVFDTFWQLASHERQWEFIRNFTKSEATKDQPKKRTCARTYFFEIDDKQIYVCKKMFMATLSIWDGWVDSAYSHLNHQKGKVSTPDKRGRHKNHPKQVNPDKIRTVKEHVAEFPRVPSHYCRARTTREYLQNGLSLRKMAKLYQSWTETKNIPETSRATIRQYEDIVNANFNLGFFKPKKDQCKLCVFMTSKDNTPQLKALYKYVYASHIKNKQQVKKIKEKDKAAAEKDRTNIALCTYDLQKQLSCPHSQASPFFYKSKLNVFNFTIFHSVKRMGYCYLWHEGMAKKGSDEIASSVFHFINELVQEGYKEFIFYSDNCAGQNKNRFVFSMYELAAVLHSIKITHRFLEPGHTMTEVDSIHGRIEQSTRDSTIYDFAGWIGAIEEAKEELPKYIVKPFKKGFVRTFKPLVQMQNWEKDLKGNKIKWKEIKEISINGNEGNLVRLRYTYKGDYITLSPNKPGRPVNLKSYCPPEAYEKGVPLSANTIRDLQSLCESNDIPELKQPFYHQILAESCPVVDEVFSEVEDDPLEDLCVGDKIVEEEARHRAEEENDSDEDDN